MKGSSEARFRDAFTDVDLRSVIYKPSDRDVNWKPCDFMSWTHLGFGPAQSNWWEVKMTRAKDTFPFADLRPSQLRGIADAQRVGIPYWLVIDWARFGSWTISDAARVLTWKLEQVAAATDLSGIQPTSIPRTLLMSRFGIESSPALLSSSIKTVILGEI